MQKTYKFRLYPTKKDEEKMVNVLDLCRQTYNILLEQLSEYNFTEYEICSILPSLKKCIPELKNVHSKSLQNINKHLFTNLKSLHEKKKKGHKVGRLRFKGKNRYKSFTYNQTGFQLEFNGNRLNILHLSKIGDIPIRCHNNIKGKIKGIIIKKQSSGKWYASIQEEIENVPIKNDLSKVAGIDLGSTHVVYDSDNKKIQNPRILKEYAAKIKKCNRRLSRKKKGGINRLKSIKKIGIIYEKLANARDDFCHKISRYYVNNYDIIGFEDMNISDLIKNNKLAKSLLDASIGKIRQYTSYKAESAGKLCIKIETKGTTYECNYCGEYVPKQLCDRMHKCPRCKLDIPRDYNSALIIKYRTIIKCLEIGQGLPESTLLEMKSIPKWANLINELRSYVLNSEGVKA